MGDTYNHQANDYFRNNKTLNKSFSRKSLLLLPYKFAIAMCERGWCLRNIIIWHKVNPMPQSVKDRFSVDFEPILFFVKAPSNYYFEQQLEPYKTKPIIKRNACKLQEIGLVSVGERNWYQCGGRNMPTTWSLTGENMTEKHYASYPKKLVVRMLKAGCPTGGVVLDPFIGSGTTAIVARGLGMNYIGFEINPDYCDIAEKRLNDDAGVFEEEKKC